ncbi:MAG: glycosyltransferase N-terminal domain-containing protein [Paracoccus sp. (in: a-proteobacteria)]|uniref:3-deoxy-D-manno-octulosonic acid transferase n=1 Tax=Paracoccus sp. TaxID=267 RepID=UPI003241E1D4
MPGAGLGRLALWWHLRTRHGLDPALPVIPAGQAPGLVLHVSPDAIRAEAQILRRLSQADPGLRIIRIPDPEGDDVGLDAQGAAQVLDRAHAAAVLLIGSSLPPALIAAAKARDLPVILAECRLQPRDLAWAMPAAMRRQLLSQMNAIMLTDSASLQIAHRMSLDRSRIAMTGPVSEIREPLYCSETERVSMAQQMNGRHAWFAASLPRPEEAAVLSAHQAALRHSHRALLILAPRDSARIDDLARDIDAAGMTVARRSEDEDLTDEVQVLLTDGPTEMGLWYRLAPVSFMGGTLSGEDTAMRHPFEPAALGSAIVHGPQAGPFATEWQQLDGANAARHVRTPEDLAVTITELTQPEMIATLASNAWTVSTGGADVAVTIARAVQTALSRSERTAP